MPQRLCGRRGCRSRPLRLVPWQSLPRLLVLPGLPVACTRSERFVARRRPRRAEKWGHRATRWVDESEALVFVREEGGAYSAGELGRPRVCDETPLSELVVDGLVGACGEDARCSGKTDDEKVPADQCGGTGGRFHRALPFFAQQRRGRCRPGADRNYSGERTDERRGP